jgi:hypothetical protein
MLVDNHYTHCNTDWTAPECDSFHNDRCPVCNQEITPHSSTEYTEDGNKMHYHTDPTQGKQEDLIPWSQWRHHRGGLYRIVCLSNLEATKPEFVKTVTYECADGVKWSRPISEFLENFRMVSES